MDENVHAVRKQRALGLPLPLELLACPLLQKPIAVPEAPLHLNIKQTWRTSIMTLDTHASSHPLTAAVLARVPSFGDLYLELLRPDRSSQKRLEEVGAAVAKLNPAIPGSGDALEHLLSQTLGGKVRLTGPQLQAFKRLVDTPALGELSPWKQQVQHAEHEEMVSASDLHEIYLALLKPDGGHQQRFKSLQAAVAVYEPGTSGSQDAIEQELSRLIGRPVQLNEPQLRCMKELMVDEPAFAHIAPWVDLTASW